MRARQGAAELAVWHGALNGVRARWYLDTGATACYIHEDEVARMGLRASAAPPITVRHSGGDVETSTRCVRGARLELGVGWATLVDLYVLRRMPAVGLILGQEYMFPRGLSIQFQPDKSVEVTLTVGSRRVTLTPGETDCWRRAAPCRVQRLHSVRHIADEDEQVLCLLTGLNDDYAALETVDARRVRRAPDAGPRLEERLKGMRAEVARELSPAESTAWAAVLQDFADVFEEPRYETTAGPKLDERYGVHRIPLREGAELPRPSRRGNYSDEKVTAITAYVRTLLDKGYVRPSESPLGAPVLLVRKADGKWRFTVDYRAINNVTRDDNYMPPKPATLYPLMKGAKVFSRVDARDGFWGLPVAEDDRWKTAFQTPVGLFEWTVMPMGLKGSPARFQRYMDSILRDYVGVWCAVFVDDIVVWAGDVQQMQARLTLLFTRLRKHAVKLKESKCAFFLDAVRFLGNIVNGDGMSPDRDKVRVLASMPTPASVQDVRSLMGVVGFLRPYVPNIVEYLLPIQQLLKKGARMRWDDEHQACHAFIVDALLSAPVLALPDGARQKAIMTDASNYGMGAVLLQQHGTPAEPRWRPVAYMSKAMTPMQARQSPTVREFFAMAAAVELWAHELANQTSVTIYSDHRPLEALKGQPTLNPIILRRLDELQALDLRVVYQPAAKVGLADWLSRRPDHRAQLQRIEQDRVARGAPAHDLLAMAVTLEGGGTVIDELRSAQAACAKCTAITAMDHSSDGFKAAYKLHGGLLWATADGRLRAIVPSNAAGAGVKRKLIMEAHSAALGGHLGARKTLERLARTFTWQGMRKDVHAFCAACNTCQRTKPTQHRQLGQRWPLPIPMRKWSWVSLDFVTALPPSGPDRLDAVMVVVDKLTKRVRYLPCLKTITASQAAELYYREIFRHHGWPLRLVSDRGPQFTAELWQALWKATGTTLNMSTASHAQTDGQSEGSIRVLEQVLRAFVNERGDDWLRWLPSLEFAVNDSVGRTTGYTPFQLEFGQDPVTPLALTLGHIPAGMASIEIMRATLHRARELLYEVTQREAAQENRGRRASPFEKGDWAYVRRDPAARAHKLEALWDGPYEVAEATSNWVELRLAGRKHRRVNVERLRRHVFSTGDAFVVGRRLEAHRFHISDDASVELQYRIQGRWYSLSQLVQTHAAWAGVQEYHARQPGTEQQGVGRLVRQRVGRAARLGRVAFWDAATDEYHVAFETGEGAKLTRHDVDRLAYELTGVRRPGGPPRVAAGRRQRQWEVERVLERRATSAGPRYRVRWTGYSAEQDTWEPLASFDGGRQHPAVRDYERRAASTTRPPSGGK